MKKPENDNIGLGLASSNAIANEMGGNMKLKLSKKGLTVFKFKIPVQIHKQKNNN
jgi:K+-sensing histidine kinase KdpD